MSWPGMEAAEQFRTGKSYYEQQVGELHLLRSVTNMAGLIESAGIWLKLTPLGRAMLAPGRGGALQALLFRQAFWHRDLSKFVSGRCQSQPKTAHFCQSKIAHFGLGFVPPDAVLGVSDLM